MYCSGVGQGHQYPGQIWMMHSIHVHMCIPSPSKSGEALHRVIRLNGKLAVIKK